MKQFRRHGWVAVLMWGLAVVLPGQAAIQVPEGATVGLVLSGGGARGLVHVGVIRVLESQGIQPTIVTGTSMGSIVGALYASGRSAEEIDRIARTMNWQAALSDASPRRDQPYPFRELEAGMTTDVRISITKEGFSLPRGVIEGQHLEHTLGELFEHNGRPMLFNQMPRQFAAVAADIETGEAVILNQGEVTTAVRASMSIPGAIAPVERDGLLLVDGGIANNMPIDLARKMGADFIIAVDVSSPLRTRDELSSLFDIANQTSAFLVRLNTVDQRKNLRADEVLILPELEQVSSADFDRAPHIIERGLQAALTTFELNEDDLPQWGEGQGASISLQAPIIHFITVINNSAVSDKVVRAQIHQPLGQPLDRVLLEKDLSRLYGLDYFSVVRYHVVEEGGETGLEIHGVARETGNSWMKFGVELSDDFSGNSVFGLSASLRSSGLNEYGGTAFGRITVGTNPEVELRFLQPLNAALSYYIEPAIGYRGEDFNFYLEENDNDPVSFYQKQDHWGSLSLGRVMWEGAGEVRAGVMRESGKFDFRGGLELGIADEHYDDGYYFFSMGWDTLDDLGFPTEGQRWSVTAEAHREEIQAEDDFSRGLFDFTVALTHGHSTLLLEGDASVSDSDTALFVDIPFIGGFLELSGLPPRSRFGRHRALVRGVFYHQLSDDGPLPFGVPLYVGASLERGNVWLNRDDITWDSVIAAGSVFVGARTPLGPAYLSFGATDTGESSFAIYLGQRFR